MCRICRGEVEVDMDVIYVTMGRLLSLVGDICRKPIEIDFLLHNVII